MPRIFCHRVRLHRQRSVLCLRCAAHMHVKEFTNRPPTNHTLIACMALTSVRAEFGLSTNTISGCNTHDHRQPNAVQPDPIYWKSGLDRFCDRRGASGKKVYFCLYETSTGGNTYCFVVTYRVVFRLMCFFSNYL